jgi:hypothetical protein
MRPKAEALGYLEARARLWQKAREGVGDVETVGVLRLRCASLRMTELGGERVRELKGFDAKAVKVRHGIRGC